MKSTVFPKGVNWHTLEIQMAKLWCWLTRWSSEKRSVRWNVWKFWNMLRYRRFTKLLVHNCWVLLQNNLVVVFNIYIVCFECISCLLTKWRLSQWFTNSPRIFNKKFWWITITIEERLDGVWCNEKTFWSSNVTLPWSILKTLFLYITVTYNKVPKYF